MDIDGFFNEDIIFEVMKFLESKTIELTPGQNFDHPFQLLPCNFLAGWDLVDKSGPRNKKIGA